MIPIDAGYFLALVQPNDSLHARAQSWSKQIREPMLVTEYVLWETVNALSKPVNRQRAHDLVAVVRSDPSYEWLPASQAWLDLGLTLHAERPDKSWSLTDCISFVVMGQRSITRALAYDRNFEQAGFEALLRRDP